MCVGKPRINACVYAGDQTIKCVCGVGEGTKELIQACMCAYVWGGGGGGGDQRIKCVLVWVEGGRGK